MTAITENWHRDPLSSKFTISSAMLLLVAGGVVGYCTVNSYITIYFFFYSLTYITAFSLSLYGYQKTFTFVTLGLGVRFIGEYVTPYFVIFNDEEGYSQLGQEVAAALNAGAISEVYNAWGNVLGILYYLFGFSSHVGKALNACLGVTTAFAMCRVSERLYHDRRVSHLVLLMGLFLPPLVFLSSIGLKEQFIGFLLSLVLFGVTEKRWYALVASVLGVFLLLYFRLDLAYAMIALICVFCVRRYCSRKCVSRPVKIAIWTTGLAVASVIVMVALKIERLQDTSKAIRILSGRDMRGLVQLQTSEAQFVQYLDVETPFAFSNLLLAPIRSIYSPGPLRVMKSTSLEVVFEAVVLSLWWYLAFPYALLGIRWSDAGVERQFALWVFLVVFLVASYSILTFAPETFRYRWPGLPIFFMIAAHGWVCGDSWWRRRVVLLWWGSIVIFAIIYL